MPLSKKLLSRSNLRLSRTLRKDQTERSSWSSSIGTGLSWSFPTGVLSTDITYRDVRSDSFRIANESLTLGLGWRHAKPILGVRLSARASFEDKTFDNPFFGATEVRKDTSTRASIRMVFSEFDLYGFSPNLEITYSNTDSNVGLFTTEDTGFQFGIQSSF